jgi:DNA-directed RNA polymerase specialized sigma24 family protein
MSDQDPEDHAGSMTRLLGELRSGVAARDAAAAAIWERYCGRLLELACKSLDPRLRRRVEPEDIVQRTFQSFFLRQERGQFDLADRDDLLHLLVDMTLKKTRGAARRESRHRRDFRCEHDRPAGDDPREPDWLLEQAEHGGPTPEQAASFAEEVERLLAQLPEDLRRLALLSLGGYTSAEIAALPEFDCTVRTIERKRRLIREAWGADG